MALTKKDLNDITTIVQKAISENNKAIFAYMDQNLASKKEFYEMEDKLLGEVKAEREENEIQQQQLSDHEDRINRLETASSRSFS